MHCLLGGADVTFFMCNKLYWFQKHTLYQHSLFYLFVIMSCNLVVFFHITLFFQSCTGFTVTESCPLFVWSSRRYIMYFKTFVPPSLQTRAQWTHGRLCTTITIIIGRNMAYQWYGNNNNNYNSLNLLQKGDFDCTRIRASWLSQRMNNCYSVCCV